MFSFDRCTTAATLCESVAFPQIFHTYLRSIRYIYNLFKKELPLSQVVAKLSSALDGAVIFTIRCHQPRGYVMSAREAVRMLEGHSPGHHQKHLHRTQNLPDTMVGRVWNLLGCAAELLEAAVDAEAAAIAAVDAGAAGAAAVAGEIQQRENRTAAA